VTTWEFILSRIDYRLESLPRTTPFPDLLSKTTPPFVSRLTITRPE
jgi:hypothetical protein